MSSSDQVDSKNTQGWGNISLGDSQWHLQPVLNIQQKCSNKPESKPEVLLNMPQTDHWMGRRFYSWKLRHLLTEGAPRNRWQLSESAKDLVWTYFLH